LKLRHFVILLVVVAAYSTALVISTAALTVALWPKPTYQIEPVKVATADTIYLRESFDPGYYRLPDMIAGYKLLAVETSANTACMTPGTIRLFLQTSQPNVDAFLKNNPGGGVQSEVEKLSIKPNQWEYMYVGPDTTKEMILYTAKQTDPRSHELCMMLGGPIPESILTPSPPLS
jgi:hypothetical protein